MERGIRGAGAGGERQDLATREREKRRPKEERIGRERGREKERKGECVNESVV